MYMESFPTRNSSPAILLRESYRDNGKVRKRTLCNLSDWPVAHIEGLRGVFRGGTQSGALQLSLFDQRDIASITTAFPNERLVVCCNPDLAAERSRKREELLAATERDLARIQAAVVRRRAPLRGAAEIALAVGAAINRHKMAKHFEIEISAAAFSFARKTAEIAAEAAMDGIYVVRTNLPAETCDDATTVAVFATARYWPSQRFVFPLS
jgi:hypothetical protein